jgi:hypothetical protein
MDVITNGRESSRRIAAANDVKLHRPGNIHGSITHVSSKNGRQRLERSGYGTEQRHATVTLGGDRSAEAPNKEDGGLQVAIKRRRRGIGGMILRRSPLEEFLRRAPVSLSAKGGALRSLIERGK